jgi:DNA polymerase (family 10)
MERVLGRAAELGVAVECNASPNRLDLSDINLLLARRLGCKVVISTDAHRISELANMRYGVDQARRAWLTAEEVLNTRPLPELLAALRRS